MAVNLQDIWKYMRQWENLTYGGRTYLSLNDIKAFKSMEKSIEHRKRRLAEESAEAQYYTGLGGNRGVGYEAYLRNVVEPVEGAHAALALEKAKIISTEEARRQAESMQMGSYIAEQKAREKYGIWGTVGKLAGTGLGIYLSKQFPVIAPYVQQITGAMWGGGGGGQQPPQTTYQFNDTDWADIRAKILSELAPYGYTIDLNGNLVPIETQPAPTE